jgi:hypothetical protein
MWPWGKILRPEEAPIMNNHVCVVTTLTLLDGDAGHQKKEDIT